MVSIHPSRVSEDINALWKPHSINPFMSIFSHTWLDLRTYLTMMACREAKKYIYSVNSLALDMNMAKGSNENNLAIATMRLRGQWLSWKGIVFIG